MTTEQKKWELFDVTYQLPKFGSGCKEFDDHTWTLIVCTADGKSSATQACEKLHKGCNIVSVLSRLETLAGVKASASKKKGSK